MPQKPGHERDKWKQNHLPWTSGVLQGNSIGRGALATTRNEMRIHLQAFLFRMQFFLNIKNPSADVIFINSGPVYEFYI